MLDRGLLPDFKPETLRELDRINLPATDAKSKPRDLRDLLWCSIDHSDTHSIDQLTCAEALPNNEVKIYVAISDVDALVKLGSAIDMHARHNTCSIYTSVEMYPMLHRKLSSDFTSLSQAKDRLAMVVEMIFDSRGYLKSSQVYTALVKNRAKLNYNSISAWLEGKEPLPEVAARVMGLDANLRLQDGIAAKLSSLRHERGALDYEIPLAHPVFEDDKVKELASVPTNRARDIVTDFMIAANQAVAFFLIEHNYPSFRRVVKTPARWDRINALAALRGWKLPQEPSSESLNKFLQNQKTTHPNAFASLSYAISKLLGAGEYSIELPNVSYSGNFCLAMKDYTHSTAPNRRFPDLITQRLLKASLSGNPSPYGIPELEALAGHCTKMEDAVKKVERQVAKSVAAMHLHTRIGEHFEAIVTGASQKGTWVQIRHPHVEGKLMDAGTDLDVGERVTVKLISTNVDKGFIDFQLIA
ncbi:MAG: RNB domain-containing ribonuclease [Candidatus Cloacimonetes bacterium]|nr:RNB domain-containing ribonuclease [Candidatus Cloacimonadota bacterium]